MRDCIIKRENTYIRHLERKLVNLEMEIYSDIKIAYIKNNNIYLLPVENKMGNLFIISLPRKELTHE